MTRLCGAHLNIGGASGHATLTPRLTVRIRVLCVIAPTGASSAEPDKEPRDRSGEADMPGNADLPFSSRNRARAKTGSVIQRRALGLKGQDERL